MNGSSKNIITLTDFISDSIFTTTLPFGEDIILVISVADRFGGISNITKKINITSFSRSLTTAEFINVI